MKAIKLLLLLIIALSIFTVCDTPLGLKISKFDLVKPDVCKTTGECTYKIQLESEGFPITGYIIDQISHNYDIVFDWDNGLGSKNILSKAIEEGFCKIVGNTIQFKNHFEKSSEYNVTVTLNNRENGESSSGQLLHPVSLIIKKYTLYFDVKAEDGEGTYFYAYKADSYEDAERMLENFGQEYFNDKDLGHDASGNRILGNIGLYLKSRIADYFQNKDIEVNIRYIDPSYTIRSVPAIPRTRRHPGTGLAHA